MKKIIVLLTFLSFCLVFLPPPSLSTSSIQVSPLVREYTLFPGERMKDLLIFANPSSSSQRVQIKVYDFLPTDELGGLRFFQDPGRQFSASRWILFTPRDFVLGPAEEKTLPISVLVPEDAEPGTYFTAVFGEAKPEGKQHSSGQIQVRVNVGAGTLFLINVPDVSGKKESYSGHLVSFEVWGLGKIGKNLKRIGGMPLGFVNKVLTFVVRFKNTGNFYQKPEGKIEVFDLLGRKVATLRIKKQRVLPGAIIQFRTPWQPFFLLGPYSAHLQFNYGRDNNLLIREEIRFCAFSPSVIFVFGVVVFLSAFFLLRRLFVSIVTH